MTTVTIHADGIVLDLERRDVPGPIGTYTCMNIKLNTNRGDRSYISIYLEDLAAEDLGKMRDAIDEYLKGGIKENG